MRQFIYILVGTPGSGKTWVSDQLKDKFRCMPHDIHGLDGAENYVNTLAKAAIDSDRPILAETPFSLSQIQEPLEIAGFAVRPVFIIESREVTKERYEKREGKPIPSGHLTRIATYLERAKAQNAKHGTSEEILNHLRSVCL